MVAGARAGDGGTVVPTRRSDEFSQRLLLRARDRLQERALAGEPLPEMCEGENQIVYTLECWNGSRGIAWRG